MSLSLAKAIASVDKLIEQLERGAFINQVGQSSGGSTKSTKQVVKQQPKQPPRKSSFGRAIKATPAAEEEICPLRTDRTARVLHPVLIGHAASFTP